MDKAANSESKDSLRVAIATMGCRSNYADTVDLQAALLEEGAVPCEFEAESAGTADVYVINTCSVTDAADKQAYRLIRKARSISPDAKIVVTGCMAEVDRQGILDSGEVAAVVGPGRRKELLDAIVQADVTDEFSVSDAVVSKEESSNPYPNGRRSKRNAPSHRSISLNNEFLPTIAGPGSTMGEVKTRARYHLRVQEGCENSCTFCIIPSTRGRFSSRPLKDVLSDIRKLSDLGYEEVVLTGTHLGGYGIDFGLSFAELLQAVAELNPGPRIRLSSLDPDDVTPEIVSILAKGNVFCPHLHICVQAFSDKVLKQMNRRYRLQHVCDITSHIAREIPGCGIGSDVIAGFPGESREELVQAMDIFLELPFSYLHVFPYSERSGTAAPRLPDQVAVNERRRRAARWRSLAERKRREFAETLIGKPLEFVVEKQDAEFWQGTSSEFVSVKARIAESDSISLGSRCVRVAEEYDQSDGKLLCL